MLTLYGTPDSRLFRCVWACLELGLDFRTEPIDYRGGNRAPAYLAINPNGRVPALDDDGFVLWESMAINLYLADRYGEGRLLPRDQRVRGEVYRWTLWAACEFEGPVDDAAKLGMRMRTDWTTTRLAIIEQQLRNRPWLAGAEFTLADLHVAAMLVRPAVPRAECLTAANLQRTQHWFEACMARPAAVAMLDWRRGVSPH